MSPTNLHMRLEKAIEILMDRFYVSETDIIIFVIGSAGAGKSRFLNTAISEDVMDVNHSMTSHVENVESIKFTTSPWNPFGRSIIFAEIPAFDHSDMTMQKKIPGLITKWLDRTNGPKGPVDSGIIYLHSVDSQRMIYDFKSFVTLCHASGHRPTTALLVSTMWSFKESEADVIEKTKELEEVFKNTVPSSIRTIPNSVRFDGSRITACKAINSLILEIESTTELIFKTDTIIFVIGSTGAGKSTFINTAISKDVMTVCHKLASSSADVQSAKCNSWNSSGRSVVFVEIPAFDHSDLAAKIPGLITRWLTKTFCPEGPVKSGIIYLYSMASMASTKKDENLIKHLDHFVKLCHECGHKPTSVLLVSTLWDDEREMNKRKSVLEECFHKADRDSSANRKTAIHLIPHSIRFDGSHDEISACNAINLLMLDMMQQDA